MLPDNSFPFYFKNYPESHNFNQFINVTKPNLHHLLPELLPWCSPGLPAFALVSDSLKPGIKMQSRSASLLLTALQESFIAFKINFKYSLKQSSLDCPSHLISYHSPLSLQPHSDSQITAARTTNSRLALYPETLFSLFV